MALQSRLDEERHRPQRPVQRRRLRAPETALGGLRRSAHLRVGPAGPQCLTASGETRPRYDRMRRGVLLPQNVNDSSVLESRRGERGYAGSNKGTPNPDKHMKPVPGKPGFGQIKDPQTGKLSGPKPWPNDPRLGPQSSNYTPLIVLGGGLVIVGGLILAPEFTIPALIVGGLVTQ
jgi:hypothetical protein